MNPSPETLNILIPSDQRVAFQSKAVNDSGDNNL